jgi:hypothetical protein
MKSKNIIVGILAGCCIATQAGTPPKSSAKNAPKAMPDLGLATSDGEFLENDTADISYSFSPPEFQCSIRAVTLDEAVEKWIKEFNIKEALKTAGFEFMTDVEYKYCSSKYLNFPSKLELGNSIIILRPTNAAALTEAVKGIQLIGRREEGKSSAIYRMIAIGLSTDNYYYKNGISHFSIKISILPYGSYSFSKGFVETGVIPATRRNSKKLVSAIISTISPSEISKTKAAIPAPNGQSVITNNNTAKNEKSKPELDPENRIAYAKVLRSFLDFLKLAQSNYISGWQKETPDSSSLSTLAKDVFHFEGKNVAFDKMDFDLIIKELTEVVTSAEKLDDANAYLYLFQTKGTIEKATEKGNIEIATWEKFKMSDIYNSPIEKAAWEYRKKWFADYKSRASNTLNAINAIFPN